MAPDDEEPWETWEPQLTGTISQLTEHEYEPVPPKQPIGFDLRPKPRIRVKAPFQRVTS